MPDDFVNEIYPLSQIRPVSPHPSSVREERRRRREKRKGGKNAKNLKDRVSLGKERSKKPGKEPTHTSETSPSSGSQEKKSIDITV